MVVCAWSGGTYNGLSFTVQNKEVLGSLANRFEQLHS